LNSTTNQSNKTYLLKIIAALGVNLKQVEKELILINTNHFIDKKDDQSKMDDDLNLDKEDASEMKLENTDNLNKDANNDINEPGKENNDNNTENNLDENNPKIQSTSKTPIQSHTEVLTFEKMENMLLSIIKDGKPNQSKYALRILYNNTTDKVTLTKSLVTESCTNFSLEYQ
jgi:hypothetical protein